MSSIANIMGIVLIFDFNENIKNFIFNHRFL
jgi:hypothetical protein